MKTMIWHRAMGVGLVLLAVAARNSLANDPLAPYRVSKVTQTVEKGTDGSLLRVEVIRESRVAVNERVTEALVPDASGALQLTGRTTVTQKTDGTTTTLVEQAVPGKSELVVVSLTTDVRDPAGNGQTTVETRNEQGQMVVTRRVVVENVDGTTVTTVLTPDRYGNLQPLVRTVKQP